MSEYNMNKNETFKKKYLKIKRHSCISKANSSDLYTVQVDINCFCSWMLLKSNTIWGLARDSKSAIEPRWAVRVDGGRLR